jgi:hypothetical protein
VAACRDEVAVAVELVRHDVVAVRCGTMRTGTLLQDLWHGKMTP